MKRIRRVLYASDFSTASRRAMTTAVALAKSLDANLTIISVLAPLVPVVPEQYFDAATLDRLDERARHWSGRQLARLAAAAKRAGVKVTTILRQGDPASEIVRAGRSTRADLIVVGTHGRRGLSKILLGSVAERVVASAPCPVLTVRSR